MSSVFFNRSIAFRSTIQSTLHTHSIQLTPPTPRYQSTKSNKTQRTDTYIWGSSSKPALPGLSKTLLRPTLIDSPNPTGIQQIVFSTQHTVVLCNDGNVYISGNYKSEPTSSLMSLFSSSKPSTDELRHISDVSGIVQVGAGVAHTVMLDSHGKVYTSGYGGSMLKGGALGHGM